MSVAGTRLLPKPTQNRRLVSAEHSARFRCKVRYVAYLSIPRSTPIILGYRPQGVCCVHLLFAMLYPPMRLVHYSGPASVLRTVDQTVAGQLTQ